MADGLDLVLERTLDAPLDLVWEAYTKPEHIKQWFAPAPYRATEAEVELRPGGIYRVRMEGPEGFVEDGAGCILEVEPRARLVWTSALGPGFRPNDLSDKEGCEAFAFTAVITFAAAGAGKTLYRAVAMHKNAQDSQTHEEMGFEEGWGTVATQLEQVAAGLAENA